MPEGISAWRENSLRRVSQFSPWTLSLIHIFLTGGELPAMVLIDTVARLIPGVLASEDLSLIHIF